MRALLFGLCARAPDFWTLPHGLVTCCSRGWASHIISGYVGIWFVNLASGYTMPQPEVQGNSKKKQVTAAIMRVLKEPTRPLSSLMAPRSP